MKITKFKVGDLVLLGETGRTCCPYHRLERTFKPPPNTEVHLCEVVRINPNSVDLLVPKRYGTALTSAICMTFNIPDFKRRQHDWRSVHPEAIIRREVGSW